MANDVQVYDKEYDPNEDQDHPDRWGHHHYRNSPVWSGGGFTTKSSIVGTERLYRTSPCELHASSLITIFAASRSGHGSPGTVQINLKAPSSGKNLPAGEKRSPILMLLKGSCVYAGSVDFCSPRGRTPSTYRSYRDTPP